MPHVSIKKILTTLDSDINDAVTQQQLSVRDDITAESLVLQLHCSLSGLVRSCRSISQIHGLRSRARLPQRDPHDAGIRQVFRRCLAKYMAVASCMVFSQTS